MPAQREDCTRQFSKAGMPRWHMVRSMKTSPPRVLQPGLILIARGVAGTAIVVSMQQLVQVLVFLHPPYARD